MHAKFLTIAVATLSLSACYTRPVVVQTPAPPPAETVVIPVPVPSPMPPMPAPETMTLHDRVHAALTAGMGSAANNVDLRVDGSVVYLMGTVATKADHARAHQIAHDVPGVTRVDHSGLKVK